MSDSYNAPPNPDDPKPGEAFRLIPFELSTGDCYRNNGDTYYRAGINVGDHYDRIECYGATAEIAAALRDRVLAALIIAQESEPE